jgi:hypothetical protein
MALHVLLLPLFGSGWTISSSSLLLLLLQLQDEFISYMSLSESSLKQPPPEPALFTISLILPVWGNFIL